MAYILTRILHITPVYIFHRTGSQSNQTLDMAKTNF